MATLDFETAEMLPPQYRSLTDQMERDIQSRLGTAWPDGAEIAFVYVAIDLKPTAQPVDDAPATGGTRNDYVFSLLVGHNRDYVPVSWDVTPRSTKDFPANRHQVNPRRAGGGNNREVLELTYPGGKAVGPCTVMGGRVIWY
jgi:hypothetical protein